MRCSRFGMAAVLAASVLLMCLLCACGVNGTSVQATAEPTTAPEASPEPTKIPEILLGGRTFAADAETIDVSGGVAFEDLCRAAEVLHNVKTIELGATDLDIGRLEELSDFYPNAEISWSVEILGHICPYDLETLDLSEITAEDVSDVCRGLQLLPRLKTVSLIPEEGPTALETDQIDLIAEAAPKAQIDCRFLLYGQLADPETEELRYSKKKIGDGGIEVFRSAMPYLRGLKLLRLYECGITDHEAMAALRADFPEVNVVWSITIAGSPFMTDTTLVHTPLLRDKHVHLLKYFPDVQFLDIGHNKYLTSIDFLKYLPKLTVCILAITRIKDISPLAYCPEMEFLELFTTPIEDISVLASLTKLEYLNIGTMPNLHDISPIFGLKNLKMVRICGSSFDHVSRAQVAQLKELMPNCFVSDGPGDPTTAGGWRYDEHHKYTPRYALLRKQMLYDKANWKDRQSNSPSA